MHPIILFSLLFALYTPNNTLSLEKAIATNKVECIFYTNPDDDLISSHYGKCIQLRIRSGEKPIRVSYKAGQFLAPADDEVQQVILTKSGVIALGANQEKLVNLYAMCAEKYDFGPTANDTFLINGLASTDMTGLADLISKKDYQNSTGQSAMWVLSDNEPVYSITGEDEDAVNELREYVAKIKGVTPKPYSPNIAFQQPEMRKLEVKFEARIKKKGKGSVTLYNPDGTLNEVLIEGQMFYPGIHRLKFFAESIDIQEGLYKVVLTIDGVKRQEEFYRVE